MRRSTAVVFIGSALALTTQLHAVSPVTLTTFDDWFPDSVYGSWPNGELLQNPTNFQVKATGFGGGYNNIIPNPDGTGTNALQLKVTVNTGVAGFIVALGDKKGHENNYAWYGNTPIGGTNGTSEYTLTKLISDVSFPTGALGPTDVSEIDYIHIQVDPGGPNLTTPYDVTYNDLQLITIAAPANLTWNNAGGTGNGTTWDVATNQNFNNGTAPAVFNQGDTVLFNGTNNGHTAVTINSVVAPLSTTVNSPVAYVFSGTGGIGGAGNLTVSNTGALTLNTVNTYAGATTVAAGATLNVNGSLPATALNASGTVNFGANPGTGILARSQGAIALVTGGKITVASAAAQANRTVLITTGLSFGGTLAAPQGKLELQTNDMIVRGAAPNTIRQELKAGLGGTAGIIAAASGTKRLGYAAITAAGTFDGQAVAVGDVVVKYTLAGDADLSGNVNFDDLVPLAQNYNQAGQLWTGGDFTYDGVVNFDDLVPLAQNYNQSNGSLQGLGGSSFQADWALAQALVPEPMTLSAAGAMMTVLVRRGRPVRV